MAVRKATTRKKANGRTIAAIFILAGDRVGQELLTHQFPELLGRGDQNHTLRFLPHAGELGRRGHQHGHNGGRQHCEHQE